MNKFFKFIRKMNSTINLVKEHNKNEKIEYINEEEFKRKVTEFKKAPDSLVVITDFDYTLTRKLHPEEGNFYSSYCVLEYADLISEKYRKENKLLFDKYYPIELDHTMDFKERDRIVRQWYKENFDLIVAEKITKSDFQKMIIQAEGMFCYRYGIMEFFDLIRRDRINIYIISGGLYEIIEESLKLLLPYYGEVEELIHIVSNKFVYDENDKLVGYKDPFVYTFNKGEVDYLFIFRY
jgi:HAD superfamily hydrolase (TIGR01544 family)